MTPDTVSGTSPETETETETEAATDDRVKPQHARQPRPLPDDATEESAAGEEDPGASLDTVVNPLPPASRPS